MGRAKGQAISCGYRWHEAFCKACAGLSEDSALAFHDTSPAMGHAQAGPSPAAKACTAYTEILLDSWAAPLAWFPICSPA